HRAEPGCARPLQASPATYESGRRPAPPATPPAGFEGARHESAEPRPAKPESAGPAGPESAGPGSAGPGSAGPAAPEPGEPGPGWSTRRAAPAGAATEVVVSTAAFCNARPRYLPGPFFLPRIRSAHGASVVEARHPDSCSSPSTACRKR